MNKVDKEVSNVNLEYVLLSLLVASFMSASCILRPQFLRRRNLKLKASLFPRSSLPFTLIRQEYGAFRNGPSNRWNLKPSAFRFSVKTF